MPEYKKSRPENDFRAAAYQRFSLSGQNDIVEISLCIIRTLFADENVDIHASAVGWNGELGGFVYPEALAVVFDN